METLEPSVSHQRAIMTCESNEHCCQKIMPADLCAIFSEKDVSIEELLQIPLFQMALEYATTGGESAPEWIDAVKSVLASASLMPYAETLEQLGEWTRSFETPHIEGVGDPNAVILATLRVLKLGDVKLPEAAAKCLAENNCCPPFITAFLLRSLATTNVHYMAAVAAAMRLFSRDAGALHNYPRDADVVRAGCEWAAVATTPTKSCVEAVICSGMLPALFAALDAFETDAQTVRAACGALRALATADVVLGRLILATENMQFLVAVLGPHIDDQPVVLEVLKLLLAAFQADPNHKLPLHESHGTYIFRAVEHHIGHGSAFVDTGLEVLVCATHFKSSSDLDVVRFASKVLEMFSSYEDTALRCATIILNVARRGEHVGALNLHGVPALVRAIWRAARGLAYEPHGIYCLALASIAQLDAERIVAEGGIEAVMTLLRRQGADSAQISEYGCMALARLGKSSDVGYIVAGGGFQLCMTLLQAHGPGRHIAHIAVLFQLFDAYHNL